MAFSRSLRMVAALLSVAGCLSCSALYALNADQCKIDADCAHFGASLPNPVCEDGVCVSGALSQGGSGGGSGGETSDSGTAGSGSPPECTSNGTCIDKNFGQPFICQSGACLALTTPDCPLVIGADNLRASDPIIFGAYSLAPDAVSKSLVTRNIDLAVSEFTTTVTGLRGGSGGSRRTLAFVVCNSQFPNVAPGTIDPFVPSLQHLVDELQVPGIIAALSVKDLEAVYQQKLAPSGTFVINPYEQTSELAQLTSDGRLWSMLGATADLAPTYGPLLERTESYLRRDESFLNLPAPGGKLRVAIVTTNVVGEQDVRDGVLALPELADFTVKPFQVDSAELTANPDVSGVSDGLLGFMPNIIIALAGSEFIEGVFPALEAGSTWSDRTGGQQRPMYLLGSEMAPETWALYAGKQADPGGWKTFFDRAVGVTYASAIDPRLLHAYQYRLIAASPDISDPSLLLGSENVYDATYLMIDAAAAAGAVSPLAGSDLARGMLRLVDGAPYDIGPASISDVLSALDSGTALGLTLTEGPAAWNVAQGTRAGSGSVYCFNDGTSPMENPEPRGPTLDALRYDSATSQLASTALLCIPNF
jgi:hypothetical protein